MSSEDVRALTIRVPQALFSRLNDYCAEQSKQRGEVVSYSKGVALLLEELPSSRGKNGKGATASSTSPKNGRAPRRRSASR